GGHRCRTPERPYLRLAAADLAATALDVLIQRLGNSGVERRLLILGERPLPDFRRALRGIAPAGNLPVLIVLPVRDQRLVEGVLIALESMRLAEEVAASLDAANRFETELGLIDLYRLEELHHELQHLDVEDQLLERGGESPFLPAGRVIDEVRVAENGPPQRHLGLIR